MTNKLTDERIAALASGKGPVSELWEEKAMAAELQERRNAGAEPVAWIVHARGGDQLTTNGDYVANAEGMHAIHATPLYTAPQPALTMPEHVFRELVNELRDIAVEYHGTQQLRERIARACRAAMLQPSSNAEPL